MTGVILFRAQPFHNGHLHIIKTAFKDCQINHTDLYVFVGSADKSGTKRNPLPIDFRIKLIKGSLEDEFSSEELKRIHIIPLKDLTDEADNSYQWGTYLYYSMYEHTKDEKMTIYYGDKPEILLSWFDGELRQCLHFCFLDRFQGISATQIREFLIKGFASTTIVPSYVWEYRDYIKEYLKKAI